MTPTEDQIRRWNRILVRARVPHAYTAVSMSHALDRVSATTREEIEDYVHTFAEHKRAGRGLYLHGNASVGKNTVAAYLLRTAIMLNYTALFIEAEDARVGFFGREQFDSEQLLVDRMRTVDVLVLAHLGTERATEEFTAAFATMLRFRWGRGRPTLLTSYLDPTEVKVRYGVHTASALDRACTIVHVTPEDE